MNRAAFRAKITGIVQGVGFRFYTQRKAEEYGVVGYVKNLPDGSVEAYAEGDKDVLHRFLLALQRGPIGARVDNVEVEWREPTGQFSDFRITF
ncbi:MAG: acylphosphatase [Calditrichaeota bacterium]|nr:MAG: acylphosphatase [Calditrichota bacterium]